MYEDADAIVSELDRFGADITIAGEALRIRLPGGTVPPSLAAAIRAHKPAVIAAIMARRDAEALDGLDSVHSDNKAETDAPPSPSTTSRSKPLDGRLRQVPPACIAARYACPVLGPCERHLEGRACLIASTSTEAA